MNDQLAILVAPDGTASAPRFPGEADPEDLESGDRRVRWLLAAFAPVGLELAGPFDLTIWIDAQGSELRRSANMAATLLAWDLYGATDSLICGPLLITAGSKQHPAPLIAEQARTVTSELLGFDPAEIGIEAGPHLVEDPAGLEWTIKNPVDQQAGEQ